MQPDQTKTDRPGYEIYYHRQVRPGVIVIQRTSPQWALDTDRFRHALELVARIKGARWSTSDLQASEISEIAQIVCDELNRRSARGLTLGKDEDKGAGDAD